MWIFFSPWSRRVSVSLSPESELPGDPLPDEAWASLWKLINVPLAGCSLGVEKTFRLAEDPGVDELPPPQLAPLSTDIFRFIAIF